MSTVQKQITMLVIGTKRSFKQAVIEQMTKKQTIIAQNMFIFGKSKTEFINLIASQIINNSL